MMPRPSARTAARLAVALNTVAAAACAVLILVAPSRPASLVGGGGLAFFALAATAFAAMLRLSAPARSGSRFPSGCDR